MESGPRCLGDAMLGRLVRWLRILGIDTAYDPSLDDAALVERAVREARVLLTRDTRLVQRRRARAHVLVHSVVLDEQLRQVCRELNLRPRREQLLKRCLRCNELLEALPVEAARPRVPPFVARTQTAFLTCPTCERVYWAATHVAGILDRLGRLGLGTDSGNRSAPDSGARPAREQ